MPFLEDEVIILNEKAASGLPTRVGERGVITDMYYSSPNYQYLIEFDDGETAPVKESEINKLTEIDRYYMDFLFTGNSAIHNPTNEEVKVLKADYLHCKAEVEFVNGGSDVVDFDKLIVKEIDEIKEVQVKTRSDMHREVIEEIHTTFKIKNADYGNSFGEQYQEYGLLSAVIRLDDKMRRLKQLLKQDAQVKDESIRDTVLDLANYAIMTVMELDNK